MEKKARAKRRKTEASIEYEYMFLFGEAVGVAGAVLIYGLSISLKIIIKFSG